MKNKFTPKDMALEEPINNDMSKKMHDLILSIKEEDLVRWAPKVAVGATLGYNMKAVYYLLKMVSPIMLPYSNKWLTNYALDNNNKELLIGTMEIATGSSHLPYFGNKAAFSISTDQLLKAIKSQNLEMFGILMDYVDLAEIDYTKVLIATTDLHSEAGEAMSMKLLHKGAEVNRELSKEAFYKIIKDGDKDVLKTALGNVVINDLEGNNIAHYYAESIKFRKAMSENNMSIPEKFLNTKNAEGIYPLDIMFEQYFSKEISATEMTNFIIIGAIAERNKAIYKVIKDGDDDVIKVAMEKMVLSDFREDDEGNNLAHYYAENSKLRKVISENKIELPKKFLTQENKQGIYPLDNLFDKYLRKSATAEEVAEFVKMGAITKDNNAIFKIALHDKELSKKGILEELQQNNVLDCNKKDSSGKIPLEYVLIVVIKIYR